MKKLMLLMLAVLLMALPALAEENPLAPFALQFPVNSQLTSVPGADSLICGYPNQTTRLVARVLQRVPDEDGDHDAELRRLMELFTPGATNLEPLRLTPGLYGLRAVTPDALDGLNDARVDQVTVMILRQSTLSSELLILSAYDVGDNTALAMECLDALLRTATIHDAPLAPLP
jgi:hypothetical protein